MNTKKILIYMLKNISLILMFFNIIFISNCKSSDDLYSGLSRAIVRLEHLMEINIDSLSKQKIELILTGTAFIVEYRTYKFLVSARHVVNKDFNYFARINVYDIKKEEHFTTKLILPKESWIYHFRDTEIYNFLDSEDSIRFVDVAVSLLPKWDPKYQYYMIELDSLLDFNIKPPNPVFFAGYPGLLGFNLYWQKPFTRSGIISLVSDEVFMKTEKLFLHKDVFYIDAPSYDGFSGSPVFVWTKKKSELKLIGLIIGSNAKIEYCSAEPISKIIETLDYAIENKVSEENKAYWGKAE